MTVRTSALLLGLAAVSLCPAVSAQPLLVDNFDDGLAADRFSAPIFDTELGAVDGFVDFAFDYSTFGIPPVPGGTTTTGIRFVANPTDDGPDDEGVAIGILSDFQLPADDFVVSMEVYAFSANPDTDPTTEYITLGINAAAPNDPSNPALTDDVPARFDLSNGNGLAYQVIPDDGSGTGVVRFEDAGNADTGSQTILGSTIGDSPFGGDIFLNTWATITLASIGGEVTYTANGVLYDTFDNSAGTFSEGSILLGLTDVFNSAISGDDVFLVVDNLVVDVPEPASAALLGLGGLAMLRRRSA
ncbi:MAG: PEP-CTERM sorting domain-containing protein [Planctomycetota bacterium]